MEDTLKKLSVLAEVSIKYHEEHKMFSVYFERVFGKRVNESAISPRFFSSSIESAAGSLLNFYQGCDDIFVDEPSGITNIFYWKHRYFVFSNSYNRLA